MLKKIIGKLNQGDFKEYFVTLDNWSVFRIIERQLWSISSVNHMKSVISKAKKEIFTIKSRLKRDPPSPISNFIVPIITLDNWSVFRINANYNNHGLSAL